MTRKAPKISVLKRMGSGAPVYAGNSRVAVGYQGRGSASYEATSRVKHAPGGIFKTTGAHTKEQAIAEHKSGRHQIAVALSRQRRDSKGRFA